LADLLALDDAGFREMFAGSPIKRIGLKRLLRNCLIAAGNSGEQALVASIRSHLDSDDPMIAEAAQWALAQLGCSSIAMQAA
jgi:epoxyqueuosine reductase